MIFDSLLKSRRLTMLFMLPFMVAAIAFWSYYRQNFLVSGRIQGMIQFDWMNNLSPMLVTFFGFVVVLGLAYLLFFINASHKFLSQTTALPSVIYVLMTSGLILHLGFSYLLISVFLTMLAFSGLQGAINTTKGNEQIFNFGFWISLAVLFYPKFVLLVLWAICVLFFSGRSTIKDVAAVLLGLVTPVFFLAFYFFWTDRLGEVPVLFKDILLSGEFLSSIPTPELLRLGIFLFILLVALLSISTHYSISMVNQRRGVLSILSMSFFLGATLFVIPGIDMDFMYMLAFPLSYIYSQYFITQDSGFFGDLMFILLLGGCFVMYF